MTTFSSIRDDFEMASNVSAWSPNYLARKAAFTNQPHSVGFEISQHHISRLSDQMGSNCFQAVLLSSSFVRDAFRGILRARVLSAQGLRGAGMAGAVAVRRPRKKNRNRWGLFLEGTV